MENQRQTNIEICRLVSIILVMLVHTTFVTFGWETESIGLQLLAGFSIIGVNVFVLITGYFSANLKKTSLISLAFFCLFWAIIKINIHLYFGQCVSLRDFFFITSSNWFIPCYIGLLLLSPLLNTFCKYAGKNNLRLVVISLLLLEIWFDWIPPYPVLKIGTMGGCSVLSFTILYLLARYISVYDIPKWFKKFSFFIYVGCSILLVILHNVLLQLDLSMPKLMFYYNNRFFFNLVESTVL